MNPHHARALTLLQQGRFEPALAELKLALSEDPEDSVILARMSLALGALDRKAEATDAAQRAVGMDPENPFSHYALARAHYDADRYPAAQEAAEAAIRLDPDDADYRGLLAGIFLEQARWQEGLDAAEAGLALDPEHTSCANLRATALMKLGRAGEARGALEAQLARDPNDSRSHANIGWSYLEDGKRQEAMTHFREALRLDPNDEWARQGMLNALRSGNAISALMLKYSLFMSKLGSRAQWGIILAGYFGNRLLTIVGRQNPELKPWFLPVQIVYFIFVFLTWTHEPLANLALRLNRFGRLTLTAGETRATNWVGAALGLAVVALLLGLVEGNWRWYLAAAVFGLLIMPISVAAKCVTTRSRQIMTGYAAVMAAAGIAGVALTTFTGPVAGFGADQIQSAAMGAGAVFLLGFLGLGWVGNLLLMRR